MMLAMLTGVDSPLIEYDYGFGAMDLSRDFVYTVAGEMGGRRQYQG